MRKPKTQFNPTDIASAAGAKSSGWLKVGDGRWNGTVTDVREQHYEVVELPSGTWRVVDEDGEIVNGPTLERALKVALA